MQKLYLVLITVLALSCANEPSPARKRIDTLNDTALNLLNSACLDAIDSLGVEKSIMDSVRILYRKIPRDSVEKRLAFAQDIRLRVEMKHRDMLSPLNLPTKEDLAAQNAENLAILKKKFIFEKDDFRGYTRYYHRTWGKYKPTRKTLTAYLNDQGDIFLKSNYYADDWIFHTYVTILIGDEKFTTEIVETYNDNHHTESVGGKIYEEVVYNPNLKILEALSAAKPGTPVRVRFQGREYYDDAKISEADRQALADCWEMHRLITMSK